MLFLASLWWIVAPSNCDFWISFVFCCCVLWICAVFVVFESFCVFLLFCCVFSCLFYIFLSSFCISSCSFVYFYSFLVFWIFSERLLLDFLNNFCYFLAISRILCCFFGIFFYDFLRFFNYFGIFLLLFVHIFINFYIYLYALYPLPHHHFARRALFFTPIHSSTPSSTNCLIETPPSSFATNLWSRLAAIF